MNLLWNDNNDNGNGNDNIDHNKWNDDNNGNGDMNQDKNKMNVKGGYFDELNDQIQIASQSATKGNNDNGDANNIAFGKELGNVMEAENAMMDDIVQHMETRK